MVVSYDIIDDKRRNKVAKALLAFGDRVQLSVFECNLDQDEYARMTRRLCKLINEQEDSVRVYRICERCKSEISIMGLGVVSEDPDIIIV